MDKKPNDGNSLSPRRLVEYLDRYIIGQGEAKKAVAVALRNRWRRMQVTGDIRDEITPKNILMIGPTGVGKTEIARRLSKLLGMPFVKVEASKYTEVGYVGRDVESMVRDLMDQAVALVKREQEAGVSEAAEKRAEERLLDLLETQPGFEEWGTEDGGERRRRSREKNRTLLRSGALADHEVALDVTSAPQVQGLEIFGGPGMEEMGQRLRDMMGGLLPGKSKTKKLTVPQALEQLRAEEAGRLVDQDQVVEEARQRVEQNGVIFIDEIDKVAGGGQGARAGGPDVSREGVQRDLLPLVEGTTVSTKHGPVKTDHVLFIAAGAFHEAAPGGPHPRAAGPLPHPRGAEEPGRGGTVPHPHRAREQPAAPVHRPAGGGGRQADLHPAGAAGRGALRRAGQHQPGEHRRAPPAHRHGAPAGGAVLPRLRDARAAGGDHRGRGGPPPQRHLRGPGPGAVCAVGNPPPTQGP